MIEIEMTIMGHWLHTYRYQSRCLMIPFSSPAVNMKMVDYMHLAELWKECSSCVGFCCGLGMTFFEEGVTEVDNKITPELEKRISMPVNYRVLQANSTLFWFSQKVKSIYIYIHLCTSRVNIQLGVEIT